MGGADVTAGSTPISGVAAPTKLPDEFRVNSYVSRSQGTSTNMNAYLKNYTVFLPFGDMFGCSSAVVRPNSIPSTQVLWEASFPYFCPQRDQVQNAKNSGAPAVLGACLAPIAGATFFEMGVSDIKLAPPVLYVGLYPDDNQWFSRSTFVPFFFPSYPNATVFLEYPDRNPIFQATFDVWGSFSIISGLSMGIAILALCVAFAKISNFLVLGDWKSLPVLTLFLAICGLTLSVVECYSSIGCIGSVPHPADGVVFENYPWAFAFTIGILCGFYFKEVTLLTSMPTKMYSVFFWPMLALIIVIWIIFIIVPAIDIAGIAYGSGYYNFIPGGGVQLPLASELGFLRFWISMIVICLACMNFILMWGVVSIMVHQAQFSSSLKGTMVRLAILAVLACIFADIFACLWFFGRFFGGTKDVFPNVNQWEWANIINVADSFGPRLTIFCFVLMFEVKVQKEIEISKTAKSGMSSGKSTESGDGGSSSSSSTVNSNVIEL